MARALRIDPSRVERELSAAGTPEAIRRLAACASDLHPDMHNSLVDTVLRLPWRESATLGAAILAFALELVSAVPAFNKMVINALVASWLPLAAAAPARGQKAAVVEEAEGTVARVHDTLHGILRACPLGVTNLFQAVKEHMPHRRHEIAVHVNFVRQTIVMLDYCHALRARVVHLLVEGLVDLDVQIAQQLRALEEVRVVGGPPPAARRHVWMHTSQTQTAQTAPAPRLVPSSTDMCARGGDRTPRRRPTPTTPSSRWRATRAQTSSQRCA
jgi:hypothetical protein